MTIEILHQHKFVCNIVHTHHEFVRTIQNQRVDITIIIIVFLNCVTIRNCTMAAASICHVRLIDPHPSSIDDGIQQRLFQIL